MIKEFDSTNDSKFYKDVFNYYSAAVFGFTIALVAVTKPFMRIYVGSDFTDSWHFVPLLLVGAAFAAISTFAGNMFGAIKQSKPIMTSTLIAGAANIVINYLLIRIIGVNGAVIGTVFAYLIVAVIRLFALIRRTKIRFNLLKVGLLSAISLAQAALVGFNFHIYIVSAVAAALFVAIAWKDVAAIFKMLKRKLHRG